MSKYYQHQRFLMFDRRLVVDLHEVGRPIQKLTNPRQDDTADILPAHGTSRTFDRQHAKLREQRPTPQRREVEERERATAAF